MSFQGVVGHIFKLLINLKGKKAMALIELREVSKLFGFGEATT